MDGDGNVDENDERIIDVHGSTGVVIGDGNKQFNYTYIAAAVTGGVAPAALVNVAGKLESPYRGLNAFEDGEEGLFFGREAAAESILARLTARRSAPGIFVVSGASGVGKSSLLRAGVLPRLRAEVIAADPKRPAPYLVITPTGKPLDELAVQVARRTGMDALAIRRELAADPRGFALTARQAVPPGQSLVLVVDQFEELFMQCSDDAEEERQAFVTALHSAATATGADGMPVALVVLAVRADFETRCTRYDLLAQAVQDRYRVMPMTPQQLRLAITGPASVAKSHVEEGLVDLLMAEVRSQADALPLLSYALDQAWRNKGGHELRLADYERVGGMAGSVAASAGRAYTSLTAAQQVAAQQIFMRLTVTNDDSQNAAATATRAELATGTSAADVAAVLEAFADKDVRLLTLGDDSVSISHEILLTAWDRLDEWLKGDLGDRLRYARLRTDARAWDESKRVNSYLYSSGQLDDLDDTRSRWALYPGRYPPLDAVSAAFVEASRRVVRAAARRLHAFIAALVVLVVAALSAAGVAWYNADRADQQRSVASQQHTIALSRQLAAESLAADPTAQLTARQLALAAWEVAHTDQAADAVASVVAEQQQEGLLVQADPSNDDWAAVAFSPVSALLATASDDGYVRLWNPVTGQLVRKLSVVASDVIWGLAFSPDGKLLATASGDGYARLWNPATGKPAGPAIHAANGDTGLGVTGVAFSSDGKLLATASGDGYARLWNPATGKPAGPAIHAAGKDASFRLAFSSDGKLLATASGDGYARLWNPATGQLVGRPLSVPSPAGADPGVAFSPDGKLLATTGNQLRLWNPATGQLVGRPLNTSSESQAVSFSPAGNLLAFGDLGGNVEIWNLVTGQTTGQSLSTDADGLAFSPDGTLLASADNDGNVKLLNPETGQPADTPLPSAGQVAFSPDGKLLTGAGPEVHEWNPATGSPVGTAKLKGALLVKRTAFSPNGKLAATINMAGLVQIWNLGTGQVTELTPNPGDHVTAAIFSPDNQILATSDTRGYVRFWDPVTGRTARPALAVAVAPVQDLESVTAMAFRPDGTLLATLDSKGNVRLWHLAAQRPSSRILPSGNRVSGGTDSIAFSPNGKLLATASGDGYVQLWDPDTGQHVGRPFPVSTATSSAIDEITFSPNGKLLATAGADGYLRLWEPSTGQSVGGPLPAGTGASNGIDSIAFSPDGALLATTDESGSVRLWRLSIFTNPYAALCADVGLPSAAEWQGYASGEPRPTAC